MSRVLVGAHITFKKPLGGIHARSIKGSGFLAEAASAPWPVHRGRWCWSPLCSLYFLMSLLYEATPLPMSGLRLPFSKSWRDQVAGMPSW